jgi:hypothetical protein
MKTINPYDRKILIFEEQYMCVQYGFLYLILTRPKLTVQASHFNMKGAFLIRFIESKLFNFEQCKKESNPDFDFASKSPISNDTQSYEYNQMRTTHKARLFVETNFAL